MGSAFSPAVPKIKWDSNPLRLLDYRKPLPLPAELTCLLPENMNESLASMVISTSCGKGVRLWMI